MKIVIMIHVSVDIEQKKSRGGRLIIVCIAAHLSLGDVRFQYSQKVFLV